MKSVESLITTTECYITLTAHVYHNFSFFLTCWLAVGRLSVTCRSTDGRQLTNSRPTGFLGSSSSQLPSGEPKRIMIKLLRQNNSQSNEASIHIAHNLHKLQSCTTLNAFHEEIFKLHFLLNHGRSIFSKKLVYKEDAAFCFVI